MLSYKRDISIVIYKTKSTLKKMGQVARKRQSMGKSDAELYHVDKMWLLQSQTNSGLVHLQGPAQDLAL